MARLYVGNLNYRVRERDLEDEFSRYGRIIALDMKNGFGFVEYEDRRDAEDAVRALHGIDLEGNRITVEFARGSRGGRFEGTGFYGIVHEPTPNRTQCERALLPLQSYGPLG
eukprot:Colp12_sorted_trinity150504_noHs@29767